MRRKEHEGWIALDIDGTLTDSSHHIPPQVVDYLHELYDQKWSIVFITGRIYTFAKHTLERIKFPYFLALQNGADIVEMPSAKRIKQQYVTIDIVEEVNQEYKTLKEDFIVYGGIDQKDVFFYRTTKFSPSLLSYLELIKQISNNNAIEVSDFKNLPLSKVSLIKCFGHRDELKELSHNISLLRPLSQSVIADPFNKGLFLNLITHEKAHKGEVIDALIKETFLEGPIIGAGNDMNDVQLLKRADFGIAIQDSPLKLQEVADFVAPSAETCGIIEGISQAIAKLK